MVKKIFIGIFAGFISGLFASGGGMILVPSFIYIMKLDDKVARGTSLFAVLPMVITSGIFYFNNDFIDWKIGVYCAIGGIVGGVIGAKLLKKLSDKLLKVFFAIFLAYVSVKLIWF